MFLVRDLVIALLAVGALVTTLLGPRTIGVVLGGLALAGVAASALGRRRPANTGFPAQVDAVSAGRDGIGPEARSLTAMHSGMVLEVAGASYADGVAIVQRHLHDGLNQRFRLEHLERDEYKVVAEHSGRVLDVAGGSYENGAKIIQWHWHGGLNQRFHIEALGDNDFRLRAVHSGKVLSVARASSEDEAELIQSDWHGGPNQRFRL